MLNEMLIGGMLLIGTVDHVLEKYVRIEYTFQEENHWIDVPLEGSVCAPTEGTHVLFYEDGIMKCFCGGKFATKEN